MEDPGSQPAVRATRPGLAIESLAIVVSILIAFAIDAWWEDQQEARARSALFLALKSDAVAMRAEVERVRRGMARGLEATQTFLALADGPNTGAADAEAIDELGTALFIAPSFDAPLGAVQALLAGGDLSYVDNHALVSRITALLAHIANLDREQRKLSDGVIRIEGAVADLGIDVSHLLARIPNAEFRAPVDVRQTTLWQHVADPRLRSLTTNSWYRYRISLASLDDIERELTAIDEILAEQTGGTDP